MSLIEKLFALSEKGSTVKTEVVAGLTTFLTMAYIVFLQPAILTGAVTNSPTGMDFGAVLVATCISAALATALMGLMANLPIAQAPGMGENFFFLSVIAAASAAGYADAWQVALGVVFVAGGLFLVISLLRLRKPLIDALSPSMKHGIAVGIGLFITFIGLQNAGLIIKDPGTAVKMNVHFASPDMIVFFFGLLLTSVLYARKIRGAILIGIAGSTLFSLVFKGVLCVCPEGLRSAELVTTSKLMTSFAPTWRMVAIPPSIDPTLFKMDVVSALSVSMLPFVIVFLFMDVFDTLGTVIGVSERAGLMKDGQLPSGDRALMSDAIGTVAGACLGTSTVTSYIESASGVEQGGRTGLTSVVTALLFLLALFFSPLVKMVGSFSPITAPALVIVGTMMCCNVAEIRWDDPTECVPAFIIMVGIPFSFSIADGLALGFISYPLIKLFSGRRKDVNWLSFVMALALIAYFVFVRGNLS